MLEIKRALASLLASRTPIDTRDFFNRNVVLHPPLDESIEEIQKIYKVPPSDTGIMNYHKRDIIIRKKMTCTREAALNPWGLKLTTNLLLSSCESDLTRRHSNRQQSLLL